jgi:hypothetical protein
MVRKTNLEGMLRPTGSQRVVPFDPLVAEVDGGTGPVGVALVDRDEDEVLCEDVHLQKQSGERKRMN